MKVHHSDEIFSEIEYFDENQSLKWKLDHMMIVFNDDENLSYLSNL